MSKGEKQQTQGEIEHGGPSEGSPLNLIEF